VIKSVLFVSIGFIDQLLKAQFIEVLEMLVHSHVFIWVKVVMKKVLVLLMTRRYQVFTRILAGFQAFRCILLDTSDGYSELFLLGLCVLSRELSD